MSHLKRGNVFGPYDFHMSAVVNQKRGLPHAHVNIKFKNAGPDVLNQMDCWYGHRYPMRLLLTASCVRWSSNT